MDMEILEDEFGDIIQKARMGLGLSIKQVAEKAGIPVLLLEDMESYRHIPAEREAVAIAGVLGLNQGKIRDIVSGAWHPEELPADRISDVIIITGSIGAYKVKGYILYDKDSREAAIFDTANDSKAVLGNLRDRGLQLRYIFLTHCHSDHVGGLMDIFNATGADICIPEGEPAAGITDNMKKSECPVKDGFEFKIGISKIRAISTSGHTQGSTCYVTKDYCFSGDTLFAGSIGRPYNCEGYGTLIKNVKEKVLSLGKHMRIFPGHGPTTTVGEELAHNPFFS